MERNTVKDRLIAYLSEKKLSKAEFGRRIGASSAFVTSMRKSMQPDKIERIAQEFPDLNIVWLQTGEGEMLKGSAERSDVSLCFDITTIQGGAGHGTGMEQPHIARIEAGRYSVGVDILGKIATALGKRVDIVD